MLVSKLDLLDVGKMNTTASRGQQVFWSPEMLRCWCWR